jgi:hypothetical protein
MSPFPFAECRFLPWVIVAAPIEALSLERTALAFFAACKIDSAQHAEARRREPVSGAIRPARMLSKIPVRASVEIQDGPESLARFTIEPPPCSL